VKEVSTQGVGCASEEASDLVTPPLNLVLYMHLRIFAYTSNVLIASFEYMELILRHSEKLHVVAEVLFVDRPRVGDEVDLVYLPALSLDHRADGAAEGSVLVLGCILDPDKVMFAAI
jgi:hypothetical protein